MRTAGSRGLAVAGYSASAALITGLVVTLCGRFSGVMIGGVLAAYLLVVGLLFFRHLNRVTAQQQRETVKEMSSDISELKALHQEIDQRKQHFKELFEIVPCYISIQNREYRIEETNALFKQDFGEREDVHCYAAYKGREDICPGCPVQKSFADGEIHSSEETVITRDGREAQMMVHSMPIRDKQGEITSVMEVSTNITKLKRLQHQLAMMGLAVAEMAHRLKNILMGLEGGIFVVNTGFEDNDNETVKEGWGMVERNVTTISRIVKDLLFCSKERRPEYQDDISLAGLLEEITQNYRPSVEADGIKLVLELDPKVGRGRFDPAGIHNLVENLLTNAIDACRFDPAPGKQHAIKLRCTRQPDADEVLIEISDNGAGIPDKMSDKVFKGFFSTKGTAGTGLGLLVVEKVAREHGGSVTYTSKPGEGTTFKVLLSTGPRGPAPPSAQS